jgi:hypothetical protein
MELHKWLAKLLNSDVAGIVMEYHVTLATVTMINQRTLEKKIVGPQVAQAKFLSLNRPNLMTNVKKQAKESIDIDSIHINDRPWQKKDELLSLQEILLFTYPKCHLEIKIQYTPIYTWAEQQINVARWCAAHPWQGQIEDPDVLETKLNIKPGKIITWARKVKLRSIYMIQLINDNMGIDPRVVKEFLHDIRHTRSYLKLYSR